MLLIIIAITISGILTIYSGLADYISGDRFTESALFKYSASFTGFFVFLYWLYKIVNPKI